MALAAKLYRDERAADRQAVNLDATLRKPDQRPVDILIEDLSATGFRMTGAGELALGAVLSVGISGIGRRDARVVRHGDDHDGCEFVVPIAAAEIARAQTVDTIVRADFGTSPAPLEDPALDAGEQTIRRFRGVILMAGAALPWMAIGAVAHAIWQ
ncbi:MAG TPA: PilZ domain-containing protein [Sphingomonas sp.]|nr:PilZ domain-containing protein [Sphingomonas sp.]